MSEHTKGKLTTYLSGADIAQVGGGHVAHVEGYSDAEAQEIARRLVACWNACEGIPTQWIEGGAADIIEHAVGLVRQRDMLLEALQKFSSLYGYLWDSADVAGAGFLSPESVEKYDQAHVQAKEAIAAALGQEGGV